MDDARALAGLRDRYWFDTEFIEDGKTIELVSIGIVSENGRTYYAEVDGVDYGRADPWLHENVFPHLTGETKPREQIADEVAAFVGEKPEFWAYYAGYDWVALCQLYGRMIDLPKGWPMYCRDVKQMADAAGVSKLPKQTTTEHHALADAADTKAKWDALDRLAAPEGVGLTRYEMLPVMFYGSPACNATNASWGEWVRHEDAARRIADLEHRLAEAERVNIAAEQRLKDEIVVERRASHRSELAASAAERDLAEARKRIGELEAGLRSLRHDVILLVEEEGDYEPLVADIDALLSPQGQAPDTGGQADA